MTPRPMLAHHCRISSRPRPATSRRALLCCSVLWIWPQFALAEIIYSGPMNIAIPQNFEGCFIRLTDPAGAVPSSAGWHLNPFFGGLGIANSPNFQPVRIGTGNEDSILALALGSTIGGSSTFSTGWGGSGAEDDSGHLGPGASQFTSGQIGYMGFKLIRDETVNYGWMRLNLTANDDTGRILDWAYDSSGHSILSGTVKDLGLQPLVAAAGTTQTVTAAAAGTGSSAISGILIDPTAQIIFDQGNTGGEFAGTIGGDGEIQISGSGGLRLSGDNTFSGTASVREGSKLTVSNNDNLGGALVKLGTASELVFDSSIENNGTSNKFTNDIALDGAAVTLRNSGDGVVELAGRINGAGQLVKDGTGDVMLTGISTYSGNTLIKDGKLVVNGSISTSMLTVVHTGAGLGGSGTVGGLTVHAGAELTPGNSPGNLIINGDFTLEGAYVWELASFSTEGPGMNYDTVTINLGNADITGSSLSLSLGGFAPTGIGFWQTNQVWEGIINNTGGGTLTGFFAPIDNSSWLSLGSFSTATSGNDVNLVWTAAIPEARTFLLGSFGLLALLGRRSRGKSPDC